MVLTVGYDPTLPSPQLSVLPLSLRQVGADGRNRAFSYCIPHSRAAIDTTSALLVVLGGNDPPSLPYQGTALPLSYRTMECVTGFEPA